MKTEEEILEARRVLAWRFATEKMTADQYILMMGMVNALAWVCGLDSGSTTARLVAGEPLGGQNPDDLTAAGN